MMGLIPITHGVHEVDMIVSVLCNKNGIMHDLDLPRTRVYLLIRMRH